MFGAGPSFDELLDRLHDAGWAHPKWKRSPSGGVRLYGRTPNGTYDYVAPNLDACAKGVIDCELSCSDKVRDAARNSK